MAQCTSLTEDPGAETPNLFQTPGTSIDFKGDRKVTLAGQAYFTWSDGDCRGKLVDICRDQKAHWSTPGFSAAEAVSVLTGDDHLVIGPSLAG